MPHIATIAPADARGELAKIYDDIQATMGSVPAAFQLGGVSPELLRHHWDAIAYYMQHPTLSGALLAFLRMWVSKEAKCPYCIGMNGSFLINFYGWSTEQLAAAKEDIAAAPLSEKEKALVRYCVDAVRDLGRVDPQRLDSLRRLGWTDRDLYDGLSHAARNVASDIVFNAFGLEEEPAL